ncbi:hypothetical protein NLU13_3153 [Sarocladium strictum]|uniref:HMG box domain-containing protein n=1 Tax=Sarocladium strictum TaxID=5046 RepID=A0AA39GMX2_SARSR|nr:hypothetical protein NLU13_3153 [Sarocladium strictum]
MTHELEPVFRELGLAQYLDAFVDQGFDTWDTILDIQESDLDALGVKLGHRRKLQRRIANVRGIAPSVSLPLKLISDESKQESSRTDPIRLENSQDGAGVVKRKYRRHPKPDENAPERPPSAYVLFSNKMREDLKSQNLTFTEIAKLVGENWQNLAAPEKEAYETQANTAKEKYHRDLLEYKKTPEYRKYTHYLQEFKEKQARQNHIHDSSKRPKLEPGRLRHGSSSSSIPGGTNSTGSGSGSGSERLQGSEPPPTRKERVNSTASMADSHYSANGLPQLSQRNSLEETATSPLIGHMESSPRAPYHRNQPPPTWKEANKIDATGRQPLPSLSDMLDDQKMTGLRMTAPAEPTFGPGFVPANHPRGVPMHSANPAMTGARIPYLRHEPSSTGSSGSVSSTSSFARTPGEGQVPIHALLADRAAAAPSQASTPPSSAGMASPTEPGTGAYMGTPGPHGYGFQSAQSAFQNMRVEEAGDGDVLMTSVEDHMTGLDRNRKDNLDGMSALLRAGEIVDRHGRE